MNGPHDLGGRHGFGPIAPESDEPIFHAPWEARVLAMTLGAGAMGHWTIDESRHARESLHPADYYTSSYYAIWIKGLERLLVSHGFVTAEELAAGKAIDRTRTPKKVLKAEDVGSTLAKGGPSDRDPGGAKPLYAPGARVRTAVMNPRHHTRLPAYARGKTGTVEKVQGFHVFPDQSAHGDADAAQWLYTVVFDATELWGRDAAPDQSVSIDAFESYLVRQ